MRHVRLAFPAVLAALALAFAATASAEPSQDLAVGGGVANGEHFAVGANSGPLGEDPHGSVMVRTSRTIGGPLETFHGDVSEGCLVVVGNRAAAVGRLSEAQQFVEPTTGRLVEFAAVLSEDNGEPGSDPPDRAFPVLLFTQTATNVCAGSTLLFLFAGPLESGNVVVNDAIA